jgi:hypothetical protein
MYRLVQTSSPDFQTAASSGTATNLFGILGVIFGHCANNGWPLLHLFGGNDTRDSTP